MQKILENKLFLISVFIIMLINLTYAAPACWETVTCEYSGQIDSGSIISVSYDDEEAKKEEYCVLVHLSPEASSNRLIEIVIHQGQFQGGNSETKRLIVDRDFAENVPVVFKMSKDTSPTTIICNDISPSSGAGQPYTVIKSLNYWSASYDQQWYTNENGTPEYFREEIKNEILNAYNGLDHNFYIKNETKVSDTNISYNYVHIDSDLNTNPDIAAISYLFTFLSIFGMFFIVQASGKEWF